MTCPWCRKCMRVQVTITYAILTAVFLGLFWAGPSSPALQWLCVAAVGFGLYGPQMLIGLAGAETVSPESVSACQGFLGWVSYFGACLVWVDRLLHPLSKMVPPELRTACQSFLS